MQPDITALTKGTRKRSGLTKSVFMDCCPLTRITAPSYPHHIINTLKSSKLRGLATPSLPWRYIFWGPDEKPDVEQNMTKSRTLAFTLVLSAVGTPVGLTQHGMTRYVFGDGSPVRTPGKVVGFHEKRQKDAYTRPIHFG